MRKQASKQTQYFYELDLLRFLAALSVVLFHYTFLNATESSAVAAYPVLSVAFKYGYLGVELFFIISGFVILLTAKNKDCRRFIISRVARLYPAFWVAVTLTTLVVLLLDDSAKISLSQYVWNLTMVGNLANVDNIDPVYWTLQVELKFYFWVFVILLFNKLRYIEFFIFIWLAVSLLEVFHFAHGLTHFLLIPKWAPYFSAGALFFLAYTEGFNLKRLFLLLLAYCLSIYYVTQDINEKLVLYANDFSPITASILITIFYGLFLLIATKKAVALRHHWFAIVGVITYPLYLVHQKIGLIIYQLVADSINKYLLLITLVSAMVMFSYFIHKYIESRSIIGLKRWLLSILNVREKQ